MSVAPQWDVCAVLEDSAGSNCTAGSPQRGGLGARADGTLSLLVCLYCFSVLSLPVCPYHLVFWTSQTKRRALVFEGDMSVDCSGTWPVLLPQKPEIHSLVLIPTAAASPCPFPFRDTVCWLHILPRGQQAGRTEPSAIVQGRKRPCASVNRAHLLFLFISESKEKIYLWIHTKPTLLF